MASCGYLWVLASRGDGDWVHWQEIGKLERLTPITPCRGLRGTIGGYARDPERRPLGEARRIPSRLWEYSTRP
jgi:hypothetical protein